MIRIAFAVAVTALAVTAVTGVSRAAPIAPLAPGVASDASSGYITHVWCRWGHCYHRRWCYWHPRACGWSVSSYDPACPGKPKKTSHLKGGVWRWRRADESGRGAERSGGNGPCVPRAPAAAGNRIRRVSPL